MITIKLKYQSNQEFQEFLHGLRTQYSSLYRYSYNRLSDGLSKKEIYHLSLTLNNMGLIKSRMINDCVDFASILYEKDKKINHKSIFGSKKEFIRKCKGLITKEEYKQKRLINYYNQGEQAFKGNRYFKLDVINKKIIFKYDRKHHYELIFNGLSKNYEKQLLQLQELCQNKLSKYSITLDDQYIRISFEEIKNQNIKLINNRFIGIDLNPNNISISICNFKNKQNILYSEAYEFKNIKSENKLRYELYELCKRIDNLSKHYQCKFIFVENLNIESKDHNQGKKFNGKINLWKRNLIINNLTKRCNINNQKLYKIFPQYSSLIGNCMYDYIDPINASIEIARRGYECIILKNKKFYPTFWLKPSLKHQWKEMVNDMSDNWKELFVLIKNLKLSYRVSLNNCNRDYSVYSKKVRNVIFLCFL